MRNEQLARALCKSHLADYSGTEFSSNKVMKLAEPVVHEVCHAVQFGIRVRRGVSDDITNRFDRLNRVSPTLGLVTEANVLAIEARVLQRLGWTRYVRFMALVKSIWATGYSGQPISCRDFLALYRRMRRESELDAMASKVIRALVRLGKQVEA